MRHWKMAFAVVALTVILAAIPAFCQEEEEAARPAAPAPAAQAPAEAAAAARDLTIYGEVQAVNAEAGLVTVQYYDYDSDEEKTAEIAVAKGAKIEGAAALGEIKKGDWIDATYTVEGGKFVAKSIIVEKEEAVEEAPAGAPEETVTTEPMEE